MTQETPLLVALVALFVAALAVAAASFVLIRRESRARRAAGLPPGRSAPDDSRSPAARSGD